MSHCEISLLVAGILVSAPRSYFEIQREGYDDAFVRMQWDLATGVATMDQVIARNRGKVFLDAFLT